MTYDAFLSYNRGDSDQVEKIAAILKDKYKLDIFYDKWTIQPGDEFQEVLESGLLNSKCCLIFVGEGGLGPWQKSEMAAAIDERISNKSILVVPVLLPGFFDERKIPIFLKNYAWVDLRKEKGRDLEIKKMIQSITGNRRVDEPIIRKIDSSFIGIARKISVIGDAAIDFNISLPVKYVAKKLCIFVALLSLFLFSARNNYSIIFWLTIIVGWGWGIDVIRRSRSEFLEIIARYKSEKTRLIRICSVYKNIISGNPQEIHSIYDKYCHNCQGDVPFGAVGSIDGYFFYRFVVICIALYPISYIYHAASGIFNALSSGGIDYGFIQNTIICTSYLLAISRLRIIRSKLICLCCGTVVVTKESLLSMITSRY